MRISHAALALLLFLGLGLLAVMGPYSPALASDPFSNATGWVGSPVQLGGGKSLVYFWSLSCERCVAGMSLLPALGDVSVIGVHAPEYAIERSPEAARRAAQDVNFSYPLALDHDQSIWANFSQDRNPSTVYLFDENGRLVHHAHALTPALVLASNRWVAGQDPQWPNDVIAPPHRIYLGYHAAAPNVRSLWQPFQSHFYLLPEFPVPFVPHLYGSWYVGSDFVRADAPAKVWLSLLDAGNVSVVAYAPSGTVTVQLDGAPVVPAFAGTAVLSDGRLYAAPFGLFQIATGLSGAHELVMDVPAGFVLYRFFVE
ncbi:MAG: hypothetical protein Q8P02_01320 [Candidatus Micrarchaeota archaeon]|nr:hypothetical protein [Candidatus Micrarchaeota archaeon]